MKIVSLSVRRPLASIIIFLSLTLLGGFSFYFLKLDLMPDLSIPVITVVTPYPGAGPREVENNITKVMENGLGAVAGLDKITSKSEENVSVVTLSFDWGTSLSDATNDIRDKLDLAKRQLPTDAENPFIFKFDFSMMPVLIMAIESSPERFPTLSKYIEDNIAVQIKKVNGVGQIMVMGGVKRQIRVDIDAIRLENLKIPVTRIAQVIAASNLTVPIGKTDINQTSFLVRAPGEFKSVDEINDLVLGMNPYTGASVRISDVAKVSDGTNDQEMFVQTAKGNAVMLVVNKQSNANTVEVAGKILSKVEEIKKTLPKDISITVIRDMSENIKNTISNLGKAVLTGAVFVVIVILLFLRNLRAGFIVGISIPISLIITFLFMYMQGYTLNMISLISLSIAVGMVVDNAIVILENIVHYVERGVNPSEAAVQGTNEVAGSIIASTLTTVIIFVPILFVKGMIGILFSQLAFVICLTLIVSLFVSVLLVPVLSSLMVRKSNPPKIIAVLYNASEWLFVQLEKAYAGALSWCLGNKLIAFSVISGTALLSVALVPYIGTDFMEQMDNGSIRGVVEMPAGTKKEVTARYVKEIIAEINDKVPEAQAILGSWGKSDESAMQSSMTGGDAGDNIGSIMIALVNKSKRKRSDKQIAESLQYITTRFPGAKISITAGDGMSGMMFGGGKPVEIEILGDNEETGLNFARTIEDRLHSIDGLTNIEVSMKDGVPEYSIILDRTKASRMGINMYSLATSIRSAFNGAKITKFREQGDEYDIFVRLRGDDRKSMQNLLAFKVATAGGSFVELGTIAEIKQSSGPFKFERKNEERIIKVSAEITGRDLGSVSEDVALMVKSLKVPPELTVRISGEREEQQKNFKMLGLALIIGILLVYFVMAAQFESLRDPLIIITAIPFAMMGALWAFVMAGQTLSMLSFIGLIMLVGIVVNNGIVLIDYMKILRARGYSIYDAVMEGGKSRLRPVLMTTITTIAGMIPLVTSTGQGSEMWVSMSTAVIGGLSVSTFITLFFVPIIYTFLEQGSERRALRRKDQKRKLKLEELKVTEGA